MLRINCGHDAGARGQGGQQAAEGRLDAQDRRPLNVHCSGTQDEAGQGRGIREGSGPRHRGEGGHQAAHGVAADKQRRARRGARRVGRERRKVVHLGGKGWVWGVSRGCEALLMALWPSRTHLCPPLDPK